LAQQLALLTAANTAARAFLGGVQVELPDDVPLMISIPSVATLNAALGWAGVFSVALSNPTYTIYIGPPDDRAQPDDVVIFCDAWRGGACDVSEATNFLMGDQDPLGLGGICAGAIGVHRCFVRAAHLPGQCLDQACGLSLWDPSADWRQPEVDPQNWTAGIVKSKPEIERSLCPKNVVSTVRNSKPGMRSKP
jgi:hypothetical protein